MKNREELLKEIQLFVLDMDGTFYLGDRLIDGSLEFIEAVRRRGREFLFFTNNSSKSPVLYIEKLKRLGLEIERRQIMTSADVTMAFLKKNYPGASVYLLGTPALEESFCQAGIRLTRERPDVVTVGFDTTLTYEKLERACTYIREGAVFLATHMDVNCPTEDGFIPDCGAICAAISLSTGAAPRYLGKPFPETLEMILAAAKGTAGQTAFVGDRLYTDVAAGVNNGAKGILVLSGEATLKDVEESPVKPDGIFDSLGEMARCL